MSNETPKKYKVIIKSHTLLQRAAVDAYAQLLSFDEQQGQGGQLDEDKVSDIKCEFSTWVTLYAKECDQPDEAVASTKLARLANRYVELMKFVVGAWIINCETDNASEHAKRLSAEMLHKLCAFAADALALDSDAIAKRVKQAHDSACSRHT